VTQIRSLKTLTQPLTATGHVWFAAQTDFAGRLANQRKLSRFEQPTKCS